MDSDAVIRKLSPLPVDGEQWEAIMEVLQDSVDDRVEASSREGLDDGPRHWNAGALNQSLIIRNHFASIREEIRKRNTL